MCKVFNVLCSTFLGKERELMISDARTCCRVNQRASSISFWSTLMSVDMATARQPSMRLEGIGQGWQQTYWTGPTFTPLSSSTSLLTASSMASPAGEATQSRSGSANGASGLVWLRYQVLWIQPDRRTCQQESSSSFPVSTGSHPGGPPAWSQLGLERHKAKKELRSLEELEPSSTELLCKWHQGPEIPYRLVDSRCCEHPWGSCSSSSGSSSCIRPPPGWCCCHTWDRSCSGRATPTPIEPEPRFLEDGPTKSRS